MPIPIPMEGPMPILVLLLVVAAALVLIQWRRVSALEAEIRATEEARDEKHLEAENARREAREKREEFEKIRDDLQDTKAKLKKVQKAAQESRTSEPAAAPQSEGGLGSVASVVHVTDKALEDEHRKVTGALRAEIAELRNELERVQSEQAIAPPAATPPPVSEAPPAPAPVTSADNGDAAMSVEALEAQMEASSRAATERENDLKRQLRKLRADLKSTERRSQSNHQLYQVAKGQLAVIEGRLASLKQKHEGAKTPAEVRASDPPAPAQEASEPDAAPAEAEAEASAEVPPETSEAAEAGSEPPETSEAPAEEAPEVATAAAEAEADDDSPPLEAPSA